MVFFIGLIFAFLPESPWWLASKGKLDKAAKVLKFCNGDVKDYDVAEQIVSSLLKCDLNTSSLAQRTCADSNHRKS